MSEQAVLWRRAFHQKPELEFEVAETAQKVADLLRSFGLTVYENIGISGVVGALQKGQSKRSIALRADMDALPILEKNSFAHRSQNKHMHACGHDGHMAMLLGAAQKLSETSEFDGTVYFIFQPNEERGLGAQAMIDDGLFERFTIDAVYGMHNMPGLPAGQFFIKPGAIMAAEDNFKITIQGRGGHSSQPHNCIDPIVIGAKLVTALQSITSRMLDPLQSVVVSVTDFVTDGDVNVIADKVVITGDCRSFQEWVQAEIESNMENLVRAMCQAYGADYEFEYHNNFYPTINDLDATQAAIAAATAVVGPEKIEQNCLPITASEDFSSMLRVKPGAYILIGNGEGRPMLHTGLYDFNDEIMETGINYWVKLVEQQLGDQ